MRPPAKLKSPATIHTVMTIPGLPTLQVITRAFRKTPLPMTSLIRIDVAAIRPRPRMTWSLGRVGVTGKEFCHTPRSNYKFNPCDLKSALSSNREHPAASFQIDDTLLRASAKSRISISIVFRREIFLMAGPSCVWLEPQNLISRNPASQPVISTTRKRTFALYYAGVTIGSFTFEVIGASLRVPSSRRRSKSSEIFA